MTETGSDGLQRLFVALPVPASVASELKVLQPQSGPGVRLNRPEDLHVTLHFLGNRDTDPVAAALRQVRGTAFTASPGSCGSFALRGGRRVLWIGIEPVMPMLALQAAVGDALRPAGFTPESRDWVPHITLARLAPQVPQAVDRRFLQAQPGTSLRAFECHSFALYASESRPEGARYRVIETYPLGAG